MKSLVTAFLIATMANSPGLVPAVAAKSSQRTTTNQKPDEMHLRAEENKTVQSLLTSLEAQATSPFEKTLVQLLRLLLKRIS